MTDQPATYGPADWTPDHYRGNGLQPFDVINAFGLDFYEGNALKYLLRWRKKNGVEDLRKARTYVQVLIDRADQPATEERLPPMDPVHILGVEAPAADEDVVRVERLASLGVLLSRVLNGLTLTADEAKLLIDHIDAETRESTTARAVAAGNKRHVQVMYAELEEQRRRADQAEDLLRVAHETSNRSEAARAEEERLRLALAAELEKLRAVLEYEHKRANDAIGREEIAEQDAEEQRRRAEGAETELRTLRAGLRANGADPTQLQNLWAQISLRNRQWREAKRELRAARGMLDEDDARTFDEMVAAVQQAEQQADDAQQKLSDSETLGHKLLKRAKRAEAAIARIAALAEEYPAGLDTALILATLDGTGKPGGEA